MTRKTIMLNARDNVASALADLAAGDEMVVAVADGEKQIVTLAEPIPLGHKFALETIPSGCKVVKLGLPIGIANQDIQVGEHVHVHNVTGEGMDAC